MSTSSIPPGPRRRRGPSTPARSASRRFPSQPSSTSGACGSSWAPGRSTCPPGTRLRRVRGTSASSPTSSTRAPRLARTSSLHVGDVTAEGCCRSLPSSAGRARTIGGSHRTPPRTTGSSVARMAATGSGTAVRGPARSGSPVPPDQAELMVPAAMRRWEFPAMGTTVSVVTEATAVEQAGDEVRRLFAEWERRLSRFRPDSELSRLNADAGRPGVDVPAAPGPVPSGGGWRRVELDPKGRTVTLPPGVGVDLGGIAKGMAVDAAVERLRTLGIGAAMVSAGGPARPRPPAGWRRLADRHRGPTHRRHDRAHPWIAGDLGDRPAPLAPGRGRAPSPARPAPRTAGADRAVVGHRRGGYLRAGRGRRQDRVHPRAESGHRLSRAQAPGGPAGGPVGCVAARRLLAGGLGRPGEGLVVASLSMTWVATRAAGYTAFALLTASVALGLLLSSPLRPTRWPRFATTELHRFVTLLTLLFIAIHVLVALLNSFIGFSLSDVLVPFTSNYRRVWMGLGIVSAYLAAALWAGSWLQR